MRVISDSAVSYMEKPINLFCIGKLFESNDIVGNGSRPTQNSKRMDQRSETNVVLLDCNTKYEAFVLVSPVRPLLAF